MHYNKSMSMQMISDKMHFDTIALRQKMQFVRRTVITFVQCILGLYVNKEDLESNASQVPL